MDEELDLTLKLPTLEELAQIRIARSLWRFAQGDNEPYISARRALFDGVKSRILHLPIPKPLQKALERYVHFVGEHFKDVRWRLFRCADSDFELYENNYFNNGNCDKLSWTAYGTIDVRHLAGLLIRDDRLSISARYEIACNFCFQEDVERLWKEMKPKKFREKLLHNINEKRPILVYYWSCVMELKRRRGHTFRELNRHLSAEESVFQTITNSGFSSHGFTNSGCQVFSLKYFWNKMTELEQRRQIENLKLSFNFRGSPVFVDPESLRYLLLQMNLEDQTEIVQGSPCFFLKGFLNLPWQSLFFPVLELVRHCKNFTDNLPWFLSRISLDQCDEVMRQRFFERLRPLFPEHVYNNALTGKVLPRKLLDGQHEYLLEIMRDATKAQKMSFIMSAFDFYRYSDDLPSVKILVQAWVTHEGWPDLKVKLKRRYEETLDSESDFPESEESSKADSMSKQFKMFSESLNDHFST